MPSIKNYTPRGGAPSGKAGPKISLSDPVGAAMQQAGNQMADRALVMQTEHNHATARSMFNEFRSTARDKYNEMRLREGKDAHGSMEEYGEWYKKEIGNLQSSFENDEQRDMFELLYTPHREQDLDSLSRHEAVQHKVFLKSSLDGTVARLQEDVRIDPYNPDRMKLADTELEISFKAAYPGQDVSAYINQAKAANRITALQEMLDPETGNPEIAKKALKEWKDELGGAYEKMKNMVDKEWLLSTAQRKHPGNFNKQEDFIKARKDIDQVVKRNAIGQVRSNEAEHKAREHDAKIERRIEAENAYWSAIGNKNIAEARRVAESMDVEGGDFTEQERQAHIARTEKNIIKTDEFKWRQMRWDILQGKFKGTKDLWTDKRSTAINNDDMMKLEKLVEETIGLPSEYKDVIADIEWSFRNLYKDEDDQGLRFLFFQNEFLMDLDAAETDKGSRLTPNEVRELAMDGLKKRVEFKKWWFTDIDMPLDKEIPGKYEEAYDTDKKGGPEPEPQEGATISKPIPYDPRYSNMSLGASHRTSQEAYNEKMDPLGLR